jgi:hypothetical protein
MLHTVITERFRLFPFGLLSPAQHADLSSWGERIVDSQKPGEIPLNAADRDPFRILRALLRAGDPTLNLKRVLPYARPEHVLIANKEFWRQCTIAALGRHEGSA